MPLFNPDFSSVDSGIPIFDKGRYQLKVTKATPFIRESTDLDGNAKVSAGVRYALEMNGRYDSNGEIETDGLAGKQVSSYTVWCHTEGGWKFSKPFLMAASGFSPSKQEKEANVELFQAFDWNLDGEAGNEPDTFVMGDGYSQPLGRMVDVNLSKSVSVSKKDGETYENQEFKGWTPVD